MPEAASHICLRVRLFASYREAFGAARTDLPMPPGSRVADLLAALLPRIPALEAARGMVAVNQTYVGPDFELHDDDEVALIPPVSGGHV